MRPPRPGDEPAAAVLLNAYDEAFGGDGGWTAADVADEWRQAQSVWLAERGGELAGCATLGRAGRGRLQAVGCTHPDHAGQGVGALLVELGERRAGAAILRNSVLASDAGAVRLLEARAYVAGARHLRMRVDLEQRPPTAAAPIGIRLSGFRPGADDAELDACVEEAFDHRWTHQAEWRIAKAADPRFDPELWIVARDGPDVCGVVLCTPRTFGMGFVESLAVRAPWRRRGVGAALLGEALGRLWDAGERCVGLGVDADNPDAIRLYERAGLRTAWAAVPYERNLHA